MIKKKLVIASDTFLPRWDGVSRFLAEIVPRLSMKYDIKLVVPDFGRKIKIKNVNIVRIPVHKFMVGDYNPPKLKPRVIKRIIKDADIVFIQTIGLIGALAVYYACRFRKPLYAYTHSIEWELVPKSIAKFKSAIAIITRVFARYIYNKCDFIFVPCEDTERILTYAGIKPQKKIVYLGVNSNKFKPASNKENAKKK